MQGAGATGQGGQRSESNGIQAIAVDAERVTYIFTVIHNVCMCFCVCLMFFYVLRCFIMCACRFWLCVALFITCIRNPFCIHLRAERHMVFPFLLDEFHALWVLAGT